MPDIAENEAMANRLEATGSYRVLRKLVAPYILAAAPGADLRDAVFVDTETTGLDPEYDEIVALTLIPFRYTLPGTIVDILPALEFLRQPSRPIPPEATALHGISDEMVRGKTVDLDLVDQVIATAAPVIAHHADFDRRFVERLCPKFQERPWACSLAQIDWRAEGFSSSGLHYLAMASGFFYDRHNATSDCQAALELLNRTLPVSGVRALSRLLETGRKPTTRVWAEEAPFAKKEAMKARGYRWSPRRKTWYIDAEAPDDEMTWLGHHVFGRPKACPVTRVNALNRFSVRID